MDTSPNPSGPATPAGNVVDRVVDTADAAIAATQRAANSVLTGVSDRIHGLRDKASPAVDRVIAPFDAASVYTQQAPIKSLLIAAAAGAAAMAILTLLSRSR